MLRLTPQTKPTVVLLIESHSPSLSESISITKLVNKYVKFQQLNPYDTSNERASKESSESNYPWH